MKHPKKCANCGKPLTPDEGWWCGPCHVVRQRTAARYRDRVERTHFAKHPELAARLAALAARAAAALPLFPKEAKQ